MNRSTLRQARLQLRRPTSSLRSLPDFVIIGAQRSGTTSLYRYLSTHPAVAPPLSKEPQFFSNRWSRGLGWYRANFPLTVAGTGERSRLTFEATPYYLFHPRAAQRAAEVVPKAKLIALLRNPVDRAYSHHQHSVRLGLETLSFEEALEREPERLAGEEERLLADDSYVSVPHQSYSYVARGRYAEQLERWFAHFDRSDVHVLRSEDLYADPRGAYEALLRFLGLHNVQPREFPVYTRRPRDASPINAKAQARLEDYFASHNRRLESLLGGTVGWTRSN